MKTINYPYRSSKILNRSYLTTVISTVLTAIAPLVATLVDGLFASHMLGTEAFNAINVVMPLLNAVCVLTMICNMGGSVLAASQLAKGDIGKANQIFTLSIISSVAVAFTATIAIFFFLADISDFFSTNEENAGYIREYLGILLSYFLLVPFTTTLNNFVSVEGNPRLITRAVILANILNILLDISFIYVFDFGIRGLALATVFSAVVNILLIIPHFVKGKSQYRVVRLERGNGELLAENLKHGFGFNVFSIATNIFMIVCNEMIAQTLGKESLTLFGVCLQIQSLTFAFTMGLCIAGISLIGYLRAEGDREDVLLILSKSLNNVIVFYAALAALMTLVPQLFLSLFGIEGITASEARLPFFCYSVYYFCFCFISVYVTLSFQLSGRVGAKILFVFGICICSYLCMSVLTIVSPQWLWYGLILGSIPVLLLSLAYGYSLYKRNPLLSKFTVSNTFPECVELSMSPKANSADVDVVVRAINIFADTCEMSESIRRDILRTFNALLRDISENNRKEGQVFDFFMRENADNYELIVKDNGSPFDPTDTLPTDTLLRILTYRFIFGMNVSSVKWRKPQCH